MLEGALGGGALVLPMEEYSHHSVDYEVKLEDNPDPVSNVVW